MSAMLLTEHNLEFLSSTGGCTGSSESTLAKMPHYHGLIIHNVKFAFDNNRFIRNQKRCF